VSNLTPELQQKLGRLRLLALDVDGVLTDGTLYYGGKGEALKSFSARDGLGLQLLMRAGVEVAIVSGRCSPALRRRVADLGIRHLLTGSDDKGAGLLALARSLGASVEQIGFVGDDLPDLDVFHRVGLGVAVADAHPRMKDGAAWVTRAAGGRRAVREIADAILEARSRIPRGEPGDARDEGSRADDVAFNVVIPTRYGSSRLPGKPLRMLGGQPLVAHVWRRGIESGARQVLVATDDERVRAAVQAFGGTAVSTSPENPSGSDRAAEVAERLAWSDDTIVVNLQGDEPFMDGGLLRLVASNLEQRREAGIATLATPIRDPEQLFDPDVVKVVRDEAGQALYFSRSPIPWVRGTFGADNRSKPLLPPGVPFLRHLGLYAYRVGVLRRLRREKPRPYEEAESLEQLRALSLGIPIHVDVIGSDLPRSIDTEEDLIHAEAELARRPPPSIR
jgi:3-deoxy-manno-octulosonate cytidylyltransferase (CMP-KDO synthetase)